MRLHINFSVMTPLFAPIALDLQARYGLGEYSGFVYGRDILREVQRLGLDTRHVRVLSQFLEKFDERAEPDLHFLRQKEREYGDPHLYSMIAGCRFVSEFDRRRALRVLEAGFRLFEGLFDEFKPDAILSDGVACTMSYIQYAIARRRGIPFLALSLARITDRFYIIRNHLDHYERVEALYAEYKERGVPPAARARAEDFINHFREVADRPQYLFKAAANPTVDVQAFRELLSLTYRYYMLDSRNYLLVSPLRAIGGRITRLLKTFLLDRRHFEQPVNHERFVFFPLHYQPEATTLIMAPFYMDQIATVENVAKCLPIDHVLYVKEHKAMLGRRPFGYYDRLRRIPNVRLISPYADSHDLIKKSSAVCVLTSTVGWEAMLYERPVIMLGHAFFDAFDQVLKVRAMADLPQAIHEAVENFTSDRELLLKFVAATLDGLYEGDAEYLPGISSRRMSTEKIARLTDAVAGELGLRGPVAAQARLA